MSHKNIGSFFFLFLFNRFKALTGYENKNNEKNESLKNDRKS